MAVDLAFSRYVDCRGFITVSRHVKLSFSFSSESTGMTGVGKDQKFLKYILKKF